MILGIGQVANLKITHMADCIQLTFLYNSLEGANAQRHDQITRKRRKPMAEDMPERPKSNAVAITAIVVTGIIILACILALVAISIAFLANAPW
jgi:hypothetical protein